MTAPFPPGLTDSHVHVFDPARFGFAAQRAYTPGAATLQDLNQHLQSIGAQHVVLVQPSVYGTDNACLLAALARLGPARGRGIAVVDAARVTPQELDVLHAAGVRGVRLNFEVRQESDAAAAQAALEQAARVINRPGWCIQVHCAAALLPALATTLPCLRVPLLLDHFGGLVSENAGGQGGPLDALLRMLETGRIYVKLSAFYRASSRAPAHEDLGPLVRCLARARPDRLLWGSDWPHTGGGGPRDPARIEPFRIVDPRSHLGSLAAWCANARTLQQILVANPARLFGFGVAR